MKVHVNGIDIHYEMDGEGPPILLLHGNGEDHHIFDRLVEDLKKERTVYSIDTRGHGESEKVDSFHYSDMAEDVAAFISELNLKKPMLYGFSDGGIVGLMVAAKYRGLLSGLIASGANLTPKDMKWTSRFAMRLTNIAKRDPLVELMIREPHITDKDLADIDIPVLITIGEKDIISVPHAEHIAETIPDGRLIVVPGENHYSYIIHSYKLFPLISWFSEQISSTEEVEDH